MRASSAASRRSVLASLPVASAKRRAWRGLTLDERDAGPGQRTFERAMIGAGRLEDDARLGVGATAAEKGDERLEAGLVVGKPPARAVRHAMDVESVFQDIDANGRRV